MKKLNLVDKKCIIRVDFNVPLNSKYEITDDTRMRAALPTISKVINEGGAAIILSHLGRPLKKKLDNGAIDIERFTLKHLVKHLSLLTGVDVKFCPQTKGEIANKMAKELKMGEILLMENTRFEEGEKIGDSNLAKSWADLGDIFINDAFGTAHRNHASLVAVPQVMEGKPRVAGLLLSQELHYLNHVIAHGEHPFVAILGGAKVSDKVSIIDNFIGKAKGVLLGGAVSNTYFASKNIPIGDSLYEKTSIILVIMAY